MTQRWVVREGDGKTVSDIVARLAGRAEAVEEGRVFIGRRRVTRPDESVSIGDEVTVVSGSAEAAVVRVLAERSSVYAVGKPAGLPTEPDRHGGRSLVRSLAALLSAPERSLHAATRLDSMVTGIVIVARGREAARRVDTWQRTGQLRRTYVGLAEGTVEPPSGSWSSPIGKGSELRDATTRYARVASVNAADLAAVSLVGFEPVTGRLHQIRVHASRAGHPLLGDGRHGGARRVVLESGRVLPCARPLLHAGRVVVSDGAPEWRVEDPVPDDLRDAWVLLGGAESSFVAALDALAPGGP